MRRGGDYQMRLVVVLDSGTDQLAGLTGTMTIRIEKGAHFYDLDYTLPTHGSLTPRPTSMRHPQGAPASDR